jgi:YVTN family beta-propeller protein
MVLLLLTACVSPTEEAASPTPPVAHATPSVSVPSPSPTPDPTLPPPVVVRGQLARVMLDGIRVRSTPAATTQASIIGYLAAGEVVSVLDGPVAGGALNWWQVQVGSLTGWMPDRVGLDVGLLDLGQVEASQWNVWAATASGQLPLAVADVAPLVYVPNEADYTLSVIDPGVMRVLYTVPTGVLPEHVGPDWDSSRLYVSNYLSNDLTVFDARSGAMVAPVTAPYAYNLYFTPDGSKAVVMAEEVSRMDFYDRQTWQVLRQLPIPFPGIDHADFSAGGRYLLASTEYAGVVVKVDTVTMEILGSVQVGGSPVDIKLSPDGTVFYVANQRRNGVSIIDPLSMTEIGFIATGNGAHGMAVSRDNRWLYLTNRLAGTISVIDFATRSVIATWVVGGSPDMLTVSPDGTQLWTANRQGNTAVVIDAHTGTVINQIQVGRQPHGLLYFPQPGRYSLGHNGVCR